MPPILKAPFPYFGGKSRIAPLVWTRLGPDVPNYIEPFCGSCAVLLARPGGAGRWETVNDVDALLCNFWRAVKAAPDELAELLDWPVNETDQRARHRWLCRMPGKQEFADRMQQDPDLFDVKRAAWWCWLASQWIGAGLCAGEWWGPDDEKNCGDDIRNEASRRPHLKHNQGVQCVPLQVPNLQQSQGVASSPPPQRRRPHLTCGLGVSKQIPHLLAGRGISQQIPVLQGASGPLASRRGESKMRLQGCELLQANWGIRRTGVNVGRQAEENVLPVPTAHHCMDHPTYTTRREFLLDWMKALAARLRDVRVCCGDWQRICGDSPTIHCATPVAVFLDPPYDLKRRDKQIYNADAPGLAAEVRAWALARGDDPRFRIALCGLAGEHQMPATWECVAWKGRGGFANIRRGKRPKSQNRHLERVWFSPHCLKPQAPPTSPQLPLL